MNQDTIAAIATPLGGGIGIIRISGIQAETVARRIFQSARRDSPSTGHWASHHLYYGHILDRASHHPIDEVLLTIMRAPHSYTREDVVEIQCHGGAAVLGRILEQVIDQGVRLAEPGEFTRRAFTNGRIDLSQAEAVVDVINARSRQALEAASAQLTGHLRNAVNDFIEHLNSWLAELQADIEFGDEAESGTCRQSLRTRLEGDILTPIAAMLRDFELGSVFRDGLRLSIAGRPNVGKSSLLNRLLKEDRAIVTAFAGTTRDPIEQSCTIGGIPVTLVDTAGIRHSHDPIEALGVSKAREAIGIADVVLFVVEGTSPLNPDDRDALEATIGRNTILVINKIDQLQERPIQLQVQLPEQVGAVAAVSALTGEGIPELEKTIGQQCIRSEKLSGPLLIPTVRQKAALERTQSCLRQACNALTDSLGEELLVYDMAEAIKALQTITGEQVDTDLLDLIFSRFCIGK